MTDLASTGIDRRQPARRPSGRAQNGSATAAGRPRRRRPGHLATSAPVLVARDEELARLVAAAGRRPSLTIVEGEAGVGKSRLVAELCGRPETRQLRLLAGRCHPLAQPLRLGPVVEALRALRDVPLGALPPEAGALRPLLPELAGHLPPLPAPSGDPEVDRHVLYRSVGELVAAAGPAVLVLEDLQWADAATVELLRVLESQPPHHLAVVVTWRGEDVPAGSSLHALGTRPVPGLTVTRVHLSPLGAGAVAGLASALLGGGQVGDRLAEQLWAWTAGVPFAVEEVLRLLWDRQALVFERDGWHCLLEWPAVPGSLQAAVLGRVATLSPSARSVVEAAAVLGEPASEDLLVAVAGLSSAAGVRGLSEALRSAVLVEGRPGAACYGFRSGLAAQAVYEDLPGPRRRQLHQRAARLLAAASPPPLAVVAHHLGRAGLASRAASCAEAAADQALAAGDEIGATALLRGALGALSGAPSAERARVAAKLARVALISLADAGEVVATLRQVLVEPDLGGHTRGVLRVCLGRLLAAVGDEAQAATQRSVALNELAPGSALAVQAGCELAWPWAPHGRLEDHLRWLKTAERAARHGADPAASLELAIGRAQVLVLVGDPAGWDAAGTVPWDEAGQELATRLACVAFVLAGAACHLGHYRKAHAFLERAHSQRRSAPGAPVSMVEATTALFLRWAEGDWAGLIDAARHHAEAAPGVARLWVPARLVEGWLALVDGKRARADSCLRAGLDACLGGGVVPGVALAAAGLARNELAAGRAPAACEVAVRGWEVVAAKGVWAWGAELAPVMVEAMVADGRLDEARRRVDHFAAGISGIDAPLARCALASCRGLLAAAASEDGAARLLEVAARAYRRLPRPYDAALAGARSGQLRLEAGDTERGQTLLLGAVEVLRRLGARSDARRALAVLQAHDLVPPRAKLGGRRPYGAELSPREAEVAALVAAGHTNREIARALYLSPKTVEHQVGSAMRKLGVRGRRELAERLGADPHQQPDQQPGQQPGQQPDQQPDQPGRRI